MSEQMQPMVELFGVRERKQEMGEASDLLLWLQGHDVPMTPELANSIRDEFGALDRYRDVVAKSVQKVTADFVFAANEHVPDMGLPSMDATSAYWRGYAAGKYAGFSSAAAALNEVHLVAALGVDR